MTDFDPASKREPSQEELDNAVLVTVAERSTEMGASVLVDVLRDEGIPAVYNGTFTAGFRAEAPGTVRVQTFQRDAQRARQIISELKYEFPENE